VILADLEAERGKFSLKVQFQSDARLVGLFGPSGSGKTGLFGRHADASKSMGRRYLIPAATSMCRHANVGSGSSIKIRFFFRI
jgi:ribose 1,5-bisphosphokinase PhnN